MAVFATRKRQAFEFRRRVRCPRYVTFRAGHVLMQSGQRKLGTAMVKTLRRFPGLLRMAARTVITQLRIVHIFMTGRALFAQSQKGVIQILYFDFRACGGGNFGGGVALLAIQLRMLSLQREPGQGAVIKSLLIQAGDLKLPAIVFQMAAGAVGLRGRRTIGHRMIALLCGYPFSDFRVAIQAFQTALSQSEIVAGGARRGTIQARMGPGQSSGGDLAPGQGQP